MKPDTKYVYFCVSLLLAATVLGILLSVPISELGDKMLVCVVLGCLSAKAISLLIGPNHAMTLNTVFLGVLTLLTCLFFRRQIPIPMETRSVLVCSLLTPCIAFVCTIWFYTVERARKEREQGCSELG